jgi:hypothetical protein
MTELPSYEGCKSWVSLEKPLSTEGSKPVLDESNNDATTACRTSGFPPKTACATDLNLAIDHQINAGGRLVLIVDHLTLAILHDAGARQMG